MRLLIITAALLMSVVSATAGEAYVSWNHPTNFASGAPILPGTPLRTTVYVRVPKASPYVQWSASTLATAITARVYDGYSNSVTASCVLDGETNRSDESLPVTYDLRGLKPDRPKPRVTP